MKTQGWKSDVGYSLEVSAELLVIFGQLFCGLITWPHKMDGAVKDWPKKTKKTQHITLKHRKGKNYTVN